MNLGNEGLTFLEYFDDFSVLMFVVEMVLSCFNLGGFPYLLLYAFAKNSSA